MGREVAQCRRGVPSRGQEGPSCLTRGNRISGTEGRGKGDSGVGWHAGGCGLACLDVFEDGLDGLKAYPFRIGEALRGGRRVIRREAGYALRGMGAILVFGHLFQAAV